MDLLAKLGIDWGLLLAQVVNFTILLGVLTAFVYKPILRLLDQRREMVRRSVEDAKRLEEQLKAMDRIRAERLVTLDRECGEILARTKQEAEGLKQDILVSAQREADRILQRGRSTLAEERSRVLAEVSETLSAVLVRATEDILRREFGPADQKRFISVLEHHLAQLPR